MCTGHCGRHRILEGPAQELRPGQCRRTPLLARPQRQPARPCSPPIAFPSATQVIDLVENYLRQESRPLKALVREDLSKAILEKVAAAADADADAAAPAPAPDLAPSLLSSGGRAGCGA